VAGLLAATRWRDGGGIGRPSAFCFVNPRVDRVHYRREGGLGGFVVRHAARQVRYQRDEAAAVILWQRFDDDGLFKLWHPGLLGQRWRNVPTDGCTRLHRAPEWYGQDITRLITPIGRWPARRRDCRRSHHHGCHRRGSLSPPARAVRRGIDRLLRHHVAAL